MSRVKAFAPATISNVAVGFDLMGYPVPGIGDHVTVERTKAKEIFVETTNLDLPTEAEKNTAGAALLDLREREGIDHGFKIVIEKGIPMGSGLGGSAASAVGAVIAANELLDHPLEKDTLFKAALAGEKVASGSLHPDNVAPCLLGGLNVSLSFDLEDQLTLPLPKGVYCVLIHPNVTITTAEARRSLKPDVPLADFVKQNAFSFGFVAGVFRNDLTLIKKFMKDLLIEPQRSKLIPGFDEAKSTAEGEGALAFSISGSGPTVFAWAESKTSAQSIETKVSEHFKKLGHEIKSAHFEMTEKNLQGAKIVP